MKKKTVRDLSDAELKGKRALVRVDFNVPIDDAGRVTDDTRIRAAVPTIRYLLDHGARVVLLSHLGRPKAKPEAKYSLGPVAVRLCEILGMPVSFVESTDTDEALQATGREKDRVILLENTRFLGGKRRTTSVSRAALRCAATCTSTMPSARRTVHTRRPRGSRVICIQRSPVC